MNQPTEETIKAEMERLTHLYEGADFEIHFAVYPNPKDRTTIRSVAIPIGELIDSPYLRILAVDNLTSGGRATWPPLMMGAKGHVSR